jgi:hypothetical protein
MNRKALTNQTSFGKLSRLTGASVLWGCLILATGLSACTTKRSPPPLEVAADNFEPVSEALKVDLFFDATLSMEGFASTQTTSFYQLTVPLLERGVIEGWKGGQATFYKFGDDIAVLPGRKYLDAGKKDFFSDSKYNKKTLIERVIDRAVPDHLTVIVTDLFQTNADVNQLSEKLKEKFIANNLAIGVYAIRSQFDGKIYDVGSDAYSFSYTTTKPDTGRPFYLLAFGTHADVAHYFDVLYSSGLNAFPEKHVLILSRHLTSHPPSFAGAKLKTADKISEISKSNLLSGDYRGDRVRAFKITKGKANAKFSLELSYDAPLENVMEYGSDLTVDITAWKAEDTGAKELVPVENPQAKKAFNVVAKLWPEEGPFNKVQFQADLDVSDLPTAGIYSYRVLLRPGHYSLPGWIANWNMRDEEIKVWHQHPKDFNGAKTYNLENFLGTLQGAVLSTTPPKLSDVYCFIRVDK